MSGNCDKPGHRIGKIQHLQRAECLKDRQHPQNPKAAGSRQGDQHGKHRVPQPAKASHHAVHHAAYEVGTADDPQTACTVCQHLRLRGIDPQQHVLAQNRQKSQANADGCHHAQAAEQNPVDAPVFLSAQVLAGKAQIGLINGVHRCIDKVLNIGGGGISRHCHRTERVHRRLNYHIGHGEHRSLNSCGKANLHDPLQLVRDDTELPKLQTQRARRPHQAPHNEKCGDVLGNHGSPGHAVHSSAKSHDKGQIQDYIDHSCGEQIIERTPGVAHRTEDRRAEVVEHQHRHAQKVNAHIQNRLIQHVVRSSHQMEQGPRSRNSHHHQHQSAEQAGEHGCMYGFTDILVLPASIVCAYQHIHAHRQAHKNIDQQIDQRGGGAHRSQGLASCKAANHNDIRRVKQKLKDA